MSTRSISYIDEKEDILEIEAEQALNSTIEENLSRFFDIMSAQVALSGIDFKSHPVERTIYYIDEEHSQ